MRMPISSTRAPAGLRERDELAEIRAHVAGGRPRSPSFAPSSISTSRGRSRFEQMRQPGESRRRWSRH